MSKKKKAKIEQDQIEANLLKNYKDGESNINHDKLTAKEFWQISLSNTLSKDEREELIGKPLSFISQEEWLKSEMAKLDVGRLKAPPSLCICL